MLAHYFDSPIGRLCVIGEDAITRIYFENSLPDLPEDPSNLLKEAERQIMEYLEGERRAFDLPVRTEFGGFREAVMESMRRIPYGTVMTYGALAQSAGYPGAARAAGTVCSRDPLPLIYPCHRIVPSSGGIGAFGGTPEVKRKLLTIEGYLTPRVS